jgi:hypothetical protein
MSLNVNVKANDYGATPAEADVRSLLGSLLTADWRQALVARGYGWHVDVGAFSTPVTGGGNGTVLDLDQPEFAISVPSGYTLIPIRAHVAVLPGLQTTDSHETEILLAADVAAAFALGSGAGTAETPVNMRSNVTAAFPGTAYSALTGDITAPTLGLELGHAAKFTDVQGTAATVNLMDLTLLYEPTNPPFLVGPACLYGYWGGSIAATGFANVDVLVIPSALVNALS